MKKNKQKYLLPRRYFIYIKIFYIILIKKEKTQFAISIEILLKNVIIKHTRNERGKTNYDYDSRVYDIK